MAAGGSLRDVQELAGHASLAPPKGTFKATPPPSGAWSICSDAVACQSACKMPNNITRHGKVVWYFRRGHGRRIRIRGQFGSPEFDAQYQAALTSQKPLPRPRSERPLPKRWLGS